MATNRSASPETVPVRRSIHPRNGDDWERIAERELSDVPAQEAANLLQSWNLHVFMRPAAAAGAAGQGNPILPSDIIFVEPPAAERP